MSSKKIVIIFILVYVVISLIYAFSSNSTWDDDCPTRYYNTRNSFQEPGHFLGLWNRPLFVLIFALPTQFGTGSIPIVMVLIAAFSAYYLYKALEYQQIKNAYLVVPLLLFQTYYFSISRNAETEQLAVAIFCFAYYFKVKKKWVLFAIIMALLPLARLELVMMLPFAALILFKNKEPKKILLLGIPLLLWHLAGVVMTGDVAYLYNETLGGDNETNRYGHTSFSHYFERYIYFLGPIIFFFLFLGLVKAFMSKLKYDIFIFLQFVAGFLIYVMFSWKLNMGNAAGFMRNLAPISAQAAVIALWGYNYWISILTDKKKKVLINTVQQFEELSKADFNKLSKNEKLVYKARLKKFNNQSVKRKKEEAKASSSYLRKRKFNRLGFILLISTLVLITYHYFQFEMRSHHTLSEKPTYPLNFMIIGGISVISLVLLFVPIKMRIINPIMSIVLIVSMMSFTAIMEPPNVNENEERLIMDDVSTLMISHPEFDAENIHVNHIWFFWANDLDRQLDRYKPVTVAELDSAQIGSYCVWDSHYSHRLDGDVLPAYFQAHPEWVQLTYFSGLKKTFNCVLYTKVENVVEDKIDAIRSFANTCDENLEAKLCLANSWGELPTGKDSALFYYNQVAERDSLHIGMLFYRGLQYFKQLDLENAEVDFKKCVTLKPNWAIAWSNLGAVYSNKQAYDSAVTAYNFALKANPKEEAALLNRGKTFINTKDTVNAINDFTKLININPSHYEAYDLRAKIFFSQHLWEKAIADINKKIALNPNDSFNYLILGISNLNIGKRDEAKVAFENSLKLGNENAQFYLLKYFPPA